MTGLLVKVRSGGNPEKAAQSAFGAAGATAELVLTLPGHARGKGVAKATGAVWLKLPLAQQSGSAWDDAHAMLRNRSAFAAAGGGSVLAIEPDLDQQWPWVPPPVQGQGMAAAASSAQLCEFDTQSDAGGAELGPSTPQAPWHTGDAYGGLKSARDKVGQAQKKIRIAHLDTGYDPGHGTLPKNLLKTLGISFVDGDNPADGTDQVPDGLKLVRNRGHGTGTLSLLAGNRVTRPLGLPTSTISLVAPLSPKFFRFALRIGSCASPPARSCKASSMRSSRARTSCR